MRCLGIAVVYFKSKKDLDISLQKRGVIHGTEITVAPYEDELFIDTPKTDVSKPVWETVPVEELRSEIKEVGFVPPYIFVLDRPVICPKPGVRLHRGRVT